MRENKRYTTGAFVGLFFNSLPYNLLGRHKVGSRGVVLLFIFGARSGWVVKATSWPLYPRGMTRYLLYRGLGWPKGRIVSACYALQSIFHLELHTATYELSSPRSDFVTVLKVTAVVSTNQT